MRGRGGPHHADKVGRVHVVVLVGVLALLLVLMSLAGVDDPGDPGDAAGAAPVGDDTLGEGSHGNGGRFDGRAEGTGKTWREDGNDGDGEADFVNSPEFLGMSQKDRIMVRRHPSIQPRSDAW